MEIKIRNRSYVKATDLFKGFDELFEELAESEPHFSWGDNDHSIIKASRIVAALEGEKRIPREQIKVIKQRIKDNSIKFVDMEN